MVACRHVTCAVRAHLLPPPPRPNSKTTPTPRPLLTTPLPQYSHPHARRLRGRGAHIAKQSSLAGVAARTGAHSRRLERPRRAQQTTMARARARGRFLLLVGLAVVALHDAACGAPAAAALRASAISAAPEYPLPRLPRQHSRAHAHAPAHEHAHAPALPPALSPDIMPLLPSPAEDGAAAPPSDAVPTIPSSPSPPNPDALEPAWALAPFGAAPAVAEQSRAPAPARAARAAWALPVMALLAMWLV